jgi:hypothetical protein
MKLSVPYRVYQNQTQTDHKYLLLKPLPSTKDISALQRARQRYLFIFVCAPRLFDPAPKYVKRFCTSRNLSIVPFASFDTFLH